MPGQETEPSAAAVSGAPAESAGLLDNPIWHSLRTGHAAIALGHERARRYPSHIGPLAGIPEQHEENYRALAALAPADIVVMFALEPYRLPKGWTELHTMDVPQMVRSPELADERESRAAETEVMRRLTAEDAPAMVALAGLTEPGPFRLGTLALGGYYGIFEGPSLVAMTGRRMRLPGLVEVSAVCTHPHARGRGYARRLMTQVIGEIEQEGNTAFLHVRDGNPAIRLYEQLGFRRRQTFRCAVLKCSH